MAFTFLLRNVPALVYASNPAALLLCRLFLKYSATRKQAAIILNVLAHTHDSDDAQLFVLTYNADNLVPDETFLGPATKDLPQVQIDEIARRNNAALRTLSLALRAPCPVRCPPSTGSIAPKPGYESHLRHLRDLASSRVVHVVYDDSWVHEQHYADLYRLINHPERLTGIPINNYNGPSTRQTDWTVFSPIDDPAAEAPPSYDNVPAKRPRQTTSSSTTGSPPAKRERPLSPVPPLALSSTELGPPSPSLLAGSPTEKATTTTASPSPWPPSSPHDKRSDSQDAIKTTIEALLPEALQQIVPNVLAHMFAVPPSSPSTPAAATSIGTLISARIAADVESRLRPVHTKVAKEACAQMLHDIHMSALDTAVGLRDAADLEFHEELDNHKLDLNLAKEEGLSELDRKLEDVVATAAEIVVQTSTEMQEHADEVYREGWDRLGEMMAAKEAAFLHKIRKISTQEHKLHVDKQRPLAGQDRRATSMPL